MLLGESILKHLVLIPTIFEQHRVFYINLGLIRFGTRDHIQGAAFFLGFFLLVFALLTFVVDLVLTDSEFTKEMLAWIDTPLMLTIGVAIGRCLAIKISGNFSV